jgi:putative MFS transporter
MYWMGRGMGFRLADMGDGREMLWGMAPDRRRPSSSRLRAAAEEARRAAHAPDRRRRRQRARGRAARRAHWRLMIVLTIALVIDVMKPASLGFVVPACARVRGVGGDRRLAALRGALRHVVGSVLWGWLADLYGRRASILLSAVMFVGTSICGAMPSLWWNVGMCFLMGAAAAACCPSPTRCSPRRCPR